MLQFFALLIVAGLIIFPIWLVIRIAVLRRTHTELEDRVGDIAQQLDRVQAELKSLSLRPDLPAASPVAPPLIAPLTAAVRAASVPDQPIFRPETVREFPAEPESVFTEPEPTLAEANLPPLLPPALPPALPPVFPPAWSTTTRPVDDAPPAAPASPVFSAATIASPASAETHRNINWEQFMGAKLFAWLGGLAALLGVAFGVKYSFEHDLVPPEVRVAVGFVFAVGLVIGGLRINRARYAITADTFCATGIVSLYAVTFACNSVYRFAFFGPGPTFLLMSLITATAFLLAVRLEARVIAVLGILGGFLTPILLSTGQDNPAGLFGYLALLDLGLLAVALHRRWNFLVPLGMAGTVLMQLGWANRFFDDQKAGTAMIVTLGFAALFIATCAFARRLGRSSRELTWSAVVFPCVCFGFGLLFLAHPAVAGNTGLFFGFVALAVLGLFALAWIDGAASLVAIAAAGAVVLLGGWNLSALTVERAPAAMAVCLGFCALFFGAYLFARRTGRHAPAITIPAIVLPFTGFWLAFLLCGYPGIAARPGLLFAFVFLVDAILLAIAWVEDELPQLHLVAGLVVFGLLAYWTHGSLTVPLLPGALALYLLFAALHTAFPLLLTRHRPASGPTWWSQLFPPLSLLLMLAPLLKLETVSLLLWPCILLVDLIAIGVALATASITAVGIVLLLTLGATGLWIFRIPVTLDGFTPLLAVVGLFAILFFAAGLFLSRRLGAKLAAPAGKLSGIFGDLHSQLPAFSALLPFLLLIMMTQQLPLPNPSPVFGLALLLVVLVLGLTRLLILPWLPVCALAGTGALAYAWQARNPAPVEFATPLAWYLGFHAVFAVFPFVFRRRFSSVTGPWAVAALSGAVFFPLVYRLVQPVWPAGLLGALPALFALPPLLGLVAILRTPTAEGDRARLNQLAWFGGVALALVTLVFPIQFERQWITLGWALEGAALIWLFHRVPHGGLRAVGCVLLVVAFVRLALNPEVFTYRPRSAAPLLNWYLYSYGVVTACLFAGARLLAPPRSTVLGVNAPAVLNSLGVVLAFLLVNIEIADFFSEPGRPVLTFEFSGNFARDMTYTIAWALFALALLLVGIWQKTKAARYAAIALLSVALLKLFLHDLARLDSLYRIGALFAVAIIASVASFAYQRWIPGHEKSPPPPP